MRSVNVVRALVVAALPVVGCAGVQKAMDDLNKPAPKADVPNVNISVNSSRAFDGGTATAEGGGAVADGTCDKACERYLECKKVTDASAKSACATKCASLKKSPRELGELQGAECDGALALVDGASFGPALAAGAKCPPPVGAPRSPEEESVLAVAMGGKGLCAKVGSREMTLKLAADGTMLHSVQQAKDPSKVEGFGALSTSGATGDRYCWRFSQGSLMASPDGSTFTGVGTKADTAGKGPVVFQTKQGEYKPCN